MKLKFYSRGTGMVAFSGPRMVGQVPKYIGRTATLVDGRMTFPPSEEPFEVDENTEMGRTLVQRTRQHQELWPGDEYTAQLCGTKYAPLEIIDGEVVLKKTAPVSAPSNKSKFVEKD